MIIKFATQPDRKLLGVALRRAFRSLLIAHLLGAGLMFLLALLALCGGDAHGAIIFGVGAIAIGLVTWWWERWTVSINWKIYGLPIAWTVTDEGVRHTSELTDCLTHWPALERVEAVPHHLIFRLSRYMAIPARVDGLDAGQRTELLAFLHARGLLKEEPETAARRITR